ncbi:jg25536, partial [Pararge aegeria aegeria]
FELTLALVAALDDAGEGLRVAGGWRGAPHPRWPNAAGNTSASMRGMYLGRADITEK